MKRPLTIDEEFWISKYEELFRSLNPLIKWPGRESLINEYEVLSQDDGDRLFEKYGARNTVSFVDRPFERSKAYEMLLHILNTYDENIYKRIHKGTPYYFIGWTAFQNWNFERAFFYLDAAVSEDLRRLKKLNMLNKTTSALDFFLLKDDSPATGLISFHTALRGTVSDIIEKFNKISRQQLTLDYFIEKFVRKTIYSDKKHRSLLTSLYCFFIESDVSGKYIRLRSSEGGSIEPMLNNLFKGARILESILQLSGGNRNTLEQKIISLPQLQVNKKNLKGNKSLKSALLTYESMKSNLQSFQDCAFATSYIIRNTTGHSLLWDDAFQKEKSYITLSQQLINSILWSICKLW